MSDFGIYSGLAYRVNPNDMINDYENHDLRMKQNKALAESKAQIFANDLNYQNAANSFDNRLINERNSAKIKEIGQFYKDNPDALYNKDKLIVLNQMKRTLLDNVDTIRGKASDDSFRQLNADLAEVAKNPNMHNQKAYQDLLSQKENYLKFGNQLGALAADKEGYKPFVYTKPADFVDIDEVYRKIGDSMEARGFEDVKNGRDGAFRTFATEGDLRNQATTIYAKHKEQLDQQYLSQGIDPIKAGMSKLNSYVKTTYNNGEKNKLGEQMALANYVHGLKKAEGASNGKSADYYTPTILNTNWVKVPAEKISKTFGSTLPHSIPVFGGKIDNTGGDFYPEGDIYDKGYRADGKYQKTGIKVIDGYTIKPISFGVDVANYFYDPSGSSGDPNLKGTDYEDYEIRPEFKNKVSFMDTKPDKDGKTGKVLKIKTQSEVDSRNPYYKGEFNDALLTSKQKEGLNIDDNGTFEGHAVGSVLNTNTGNYLVTPNGYIKQ